MLNDTQHAVSFLEEFERLCIELYKNSPSDVELKGMLADSYLFLGDVYLLVYGNVPIIPSFYSDYHCLYRKLYEAFSNNAYYLFKV